MKMVWGQFVFVCVLILLSSTRLGSDFSPSHKERFVVWNIGQGQWTTLISEKYCDHFDIGGEWDVTRQVLKACEKRQHRVHISHWDWDHMGFIKNLRQRVALCLWNYPLGEASEKKKALLANLPHCQGSANHQSIFLGDHSKKASSNDTSQVVETRHILIPGDSTKKEEKLWSKNPSLKNIDGLILGHHGSKGSTSERLIQNLSNLKWAVASARESRYGHPHPEIVKRLKMYRVPLIKTEDWGTLVFELE